jgi:hypothetical protein
MNLKAKVVSLVSSQGVAVDEEAWLMSWKEKAKVVLNIE